MKAHIQEKLTEIVSNLKQENLLDTNANVKIMVENTKDKSHGDYATNLAMLLAKPLKKKPLEIAQIIVEKLSSDDKIDRTEIAGPGFINFFIKKDFLNTQINDLHNDPRLGVAKVTNPQTIVIDYSSPNVAKEMAVHHIRSTVIGDSVVRILEFLGHNVIRANHIGDWGTQFGMLIAYLEKKENENATALELSDLEAFYREAKVCYDSDEEFAEKARSYVVKLQSGDSYCRQMWQKLVKITMEQNQAIYDRLNISLTEKDIMGESLYNPMLKPLVEDLTKKGLAVKDEGAMVVYLKSFADKDGNPRGVIVQKKDGGFLYTTTDIACTKYRCEKFHINRMICFADSRQHEHLLMAWEIARLAGYVPEGVSLEHGAFGMMLGKDGKPFKTRSGGTVKLKDLLDEAIVRATKLFDSRSSDIADEEKENVIKTIAMGAVKYADLSKNRTTDYIFDWDNMLTFEGNTAPYLQYAYSRIQSIFKKTDLPEGTIKIEHEAEEQLAQKLLKFNEVVNLAAEKAMPHLLCTYLYELSTLFMRFYEACPINKNEIDKEVRMSRLSLCKTTQNIIKQGLSLLGINVLDRM
ncbi:MAG: arginine--tRNA ligase [Succinivibrionaceae bacterium]|nr:arginine--tRNA ligase [Ruminobacter sp.]MDY5779325.1 arginine--tRNA ligase [Succinivibrionaceae bacterium]MEE1339576.1 arginine--tRNA ligase [Succinivibrionaceae bacterium]